MNSKVTRAVAICAALCIVGCSSAKHENPQEVFSISTRKTAPQPVYNRLAWAQAPENLPSRELPPMGNLAIKPIFHLSLTDVSAKEAGDVLAATMRYKSSCVTTKCANRKVTINTLGTSEELARELSRKTGLSFNLDHQARELRIEGSSN